MILFNTLRGIDGHIFLSPLINQFSNLHGDSRIHASEADSKAACCLKEQEEEGGGGAGGSSSEVRVRQDGI